VGNLGRGEGRKTEHKILNRYRQAADSAAGQENARMNVKH